ncbi:cytochrome P450 [Luedemannella helvata]|uniref:Cytochrome P450 n=1 Tax=Luedemannella helvata TaxID=349315 RepID=A0ABP4XEY9_9ACTN
MPHESPTATLVAPDAVGDLFRLWEAPTEGRPGVQKVGDHVLVAGHAAVRAVLADPDTYAPDNALDAVTPIPVTALRVLTGHGFRLPPTLANNGTASHPEIRGIVAAALHPARVEQQRAWLTGTVRRRVAGLAARLRAGEPVDLYADLAADLPLRVLARMIELPAGDVGVVKDFSRAALELFWAPLDEDRQVALARVVGRYHEVLRVSAMSAGGMVGELREYARQRGARAADLVVGALFFLLVAGQETTSQFLTLLLHRLAAEPGALDRLAAGAVSVEDVVEEGLRFEPPIVSWRRVATRDTVLDGVDVPRGASVVLWLAAAGRDRAVVASPEAFCPGQRGARRHLAFGAGAHRCLGAQLSRMEAAVVVAECAPLLRGVRVLRAPHSPDNLSFRMPDSLVVARR